MEQLRGCVAACEQLLADLRCELAACEATQRRLAEPRGEPREATRAGRPGKPFPFPGPTENLLRRGGYGARTPGARA